jgi:dipeptidyl-peptidase-4
MKSFVIILSVLFLTQFTFTQKKQLTLDDIFLSNKFTPEKVENIRWKADGSGFTFTKRNPSTSLNDIYLFDINTLEEKLFLLAEKLIYQNKQIMMSSYEWTRDGKYLIIRGPVKTIWRHSRTSPAYILNLESNEVIALADENQGLKNVKLSPDGKLVGYVKDHNLFIADVNTGKETQLTFDGNENILNGEPDWVYEEEFGIADCWQWSDDGKKIAFWRFDQTRVKEFYLVDEMQSYNKIFPLKYPKVGEQNSIVKIGVIDIQTFETKWMDTGIEDNIYLPRIYWTKTSSALSILKLNRKQNKLDLLIADTESGKSKSILTDTDSCWVDIEDNHLIFINDANEFLWISEQSGYKHIYHFDFSVININPVTKGEWEVTSLEGYSESDQFVYFYGKKDSETEQHIYRVKINGTGLEKISDQPGWNEANFSSDYKYFIHSFSSLNTPLKVFLRKSNGEIIKTLKENKLASFAEYALSYPELNTFQTSDGVPLNYMITKPKDFDPNKKYPVIFYGYGGPGSQAVINKWAGNRQLYHSMMAQKGFIIFTVDNRGTGGRGKPFKNLMYKDISKWTVNDHIEAAKYLETLPYVDTDRMGVWGWSGGGTLTLWLLTRASDYFKAGVSVAPNTELLNYDAIWSERYMSLPDENAEGYKQVAPQTYAHQLDGKLLLVHGTQDDNVHYQHSLQMVKKLQDAGKHFELMLYPNKNHSILGASIQKHLYEMMTNFFLKNL